MNTTPPKPLAGLALPRDHRVNRQQTYDMKINPGKPYRCSAASPPTTSEPVPLQLEGP